MSPLGGGSPFYCHAKNIKKIWFKSLLFPFNVGYGSGVVIILVLFRNRYEIIVLFCLVATINNKKIVFSEKKSVIYG